MQWLGTRRVPIKSLVLPGDMAIRLKAKHVRELAESYEATGGEAGNAVWVDNNTREVVAGRDRIAAALLRKAKSVECRFGVFTEREVRRARLVEGLHRRTEDRGALLLELLAEEEAEIAVKRPVSDPPQETVLTGQMTANPPHRPVTPRGEARRAVAAETGMSVEAIRSAERRAAAEAEPEAPEAPTYRSYGLEVPPKLDGLILFIQRNCDAADKELRAAQARLNAAQSHLEQGIGKTEVNAPAEAQRLYDQVHRLAADVRAARPVGICCYCKADLVLRGVQKTCHACRGSGIETAGAGADVPPELRYGGPGVCVASGGKILGRDASPGRPPRQPAGADHGAGVTNGAAVRPESTGVAMAGAVGGPDHAPPPLTRVESVPFVSVGNGERGPKADAVRAAIAKAKKTAVKIVDDDGNEIVVEKEDPPSLPLPLVESDDGVDDEDGIPF